MDLIKQLRRDRRFYAECPACGEEFQLAGAVLWHLKQELPPEAIKKIDQLRHNLLERKSQLRHQKLLASKTSQRTTQCVNIGKMVEKIAPSFSSFGFLCGDCRPVFDPIDYLVFSGLAKHSKVDAITFVEMKSGKARLTADQREIAALVERGKIELKHIAANGRRPDAV